MSFASMGHTVQETRWKSSKKYCLHNMLSIPAFHAGCEAVVPKVQSFDFTK